MMEASTSGAIGTLRMCTSRICSRPRMSGSGTTTWRSKRPGRISAGSSTSGRLVAAITITPEVPSKPSISTSSWFSVCSRSSLPPPRPAPRWRPDRVDLVDEHDAGRVLLRLLEHVAHARRAHAHEHLDEVGARRWRRTAPSPRPAMARASSVLPVPGEPTISTPRGMRPPSFWNFDGIAQELDQLGHLFLGLVHARHVGEGDLVLVLVEHARAALAEARRRRRARRPASGA